MKLLLDTHVFLWWMHDDPRLSATAIAAIQDESNQIILSSISAIEMAIKVRLGKLRLSSPLPLVLKRGMEGLRATEWPVLISHAACLMELPLHHRDPFDRILVAQAQVEGMILVSADEKIKLYGIPTLW